jgi:polyisoprenoid-binding protein YceI
MKRIGLILGVLMFAGAASAQQLPGLVGHEERELVDKDPAKARAGKYEIDQSHVAVIGRILHGNLAYLYFRFNPDKITGSYTYDPKNPEATKVNVEIDASAIDFGLGNFDARVESPEFMDVKKYPKVTFVSTQIKRTDMNHGTMTGNLTLHGVTKPITLATTFNGAGPAGRRVKMGFSATARLNLADYKIDIGTNNVSGPVLLNIDLEFSSTGADVNAGDVLRALGARRGGQ